MTKSYLTKDIGLAAALMSESPSSFDARLVDAKIGIFLFVITFDHDFDFEKAAAAYYSRTYHVDALTLLDNTRYIKRMITEKQHGKRNS